MNDDDIKKAFLKTIPEYPKFLTEKEVFNNPELILKWEQFCKGYTSRDEEVKELEDSYLECDSENTALLVKVKEAKKIIESLKCCGNCLEFYTSDPKDDRCLAATWSDWCFSWEIASNWKGITND
jgi:hypothetical protein